MNKQSFFSLSLKVFFGLIGLSGIIVIHEFGHFFACKLFGIATPTFSIGFGPQIVGVMIGSTMFQIALLPLGGYVEINANQLATIAPYKGLIIASAGIIINFLFGYVVGGIIERLQSTKDLYLEYRLLQKESKRIILGPITLIKMLGTAAEYSFMVYFDLLAKLSIGIGLMNLLPLPLLDGYQILRFLSRMITDNMHF